MVNISKIESLIKEKGWSKTHFCKLFDHSRTWIDDWKRGKGLPDENMIKRIADRLDTTFEYLTDKSEQKNKPFAEAKGYSEETMKLLDQIDRLTPANRAKLSELVRLFLADQDSKQ